MTEDWEALVDEALTVQESAEDKARRLRHLRRDIAEEAPTEEAEALIERLNTVLDDETPA